MKCGEGNTARKQVEDALYREYCDNKRSLRDCAKIIGVSAGFLSGLQTGRHHMSAKVAAKITRRIGWDGEAIYLARCAERYDSEVNDLEFDED